MLKKGPLKFGAVDGVRIIDLNGMVADCEYEFESLRPVTGDVTVSGLCDEDFTQGTGKMPPARCRRATRSRSKAHCRSAAYARR
jgi:hypothetical protein